MFPKHIVSYQNLTQIAVIHLITHSLTHPTEIVENWQCAGITKAGWGIEQGRAAFPSFQMLFTAWNEWLWEACRISVGETNLQTRGAPHLTLFPEAPWVHSDRGLPPSPWTPPSFSPPQHTQLAQKVGTPIAPVDFVKSFLGCVKTKILNFYRETGLFLKQTNKQTNLIWWLNMRKARGELVTVGNSSDFIHLVDKASSRP